MDWLLFTYRAPMAAFGEVAGYTRRPSLSAPTRSGVLGIVAACLGVTRSDEMKLQAIEDAYGVALRVDAGGATVWDFQTAQVPKGVAAWGSETRSHELLAGELVTMLSHREYVCDGCYTVAIWCRVKVPHILWTTLPVLCMSRSSRPSPVVRAASSRRRSIRSS